MDVIAITIREPVVANFGENVRRLREMTGLTQARLAERLGVGQGQLSNWVLLLAILACVFGLFAASQATGGVALIGFACLVAIWARIAQAAAHHRDHMRL